MLFNRTETGLYALLATGAGNNIKIAVGLLYAVPGRKLRHQVIVYNKRCKLHVGTIS